MTVTGSRMRVAENGGLLCLPAPELINLGSFLSGGTTKKREQRKPRKNVGDKPRIPHLLVSDHSPSSFALITSYSFLARDEALEPKGIHEQGVACRVLRFARFLHGSVPDAGYLL
jgi:hypothetical protein